MAVAAGSHHHHRLLWQRATGPRPSPRPAVARPRSSPTGGVRPRPFPDSQRRGPAPSPTRGSADPRPSLISGVGPFPHARSAPRMPLVKGSCAAAPLRTARAGVPVESGVRRWRRVLRLHLPDVRFLRWGGPVGCGAAAMNSSGCERSFSTSPLLQQLPAVHAVSGFLLLRLNIFALCNQERACSQPCVVHQTPFKGHPVTTGGRFRAFGSAAPRQDLLYAVTPSLNMCSVRHPQPVSCYSNM